MSDMIGADLVARALRDAGATHAFGIPGGEVLALLAALERAEIRFVLAKHENAAGFMAEGLWHAGGGLPLLVATLGPGVANAVNVVANAMQDRVPLVFVTGCVDAGVAETYTHQVFDHAALLRPVVKASFRAAPGTEDVVVRKAVAIAMAGRPGPVHIDLPIGVAEAAVPDRALVPAPARCVPSPVDLSGIAAMVDRARRPLVIAGLDVVTEGSAADLATFVDRSGAALITTYKAKGVLPHDHPAHVGPVGLSPRADAIVRPLVEAADLIVLAGYDPIEMRAGWRHPWPAGQAVLDLVAQDVQHGMHHATVVAEGHVGQMLARLTATLGAAPGLRWPDGLPGRVRAELRQAFDPGDAWSPGTVFETLRAIMPPETVATADSGAHRILLSQAWRCALPRTLLQSTGLCTMGCAVPLAAGVALARGEPVLCFVGDAGLEMVLGELATIRDLALPVIIVVLVDRSLGLIELKQRQSGLRNLGVDFGATDFPAVARALGGFGVAIGTAADLAREARAALERPGFTVLACAIGRQAYDGAF